MAKAVSIDTHVVVWLLAGNLTGIPPGVQQLLESHDIEIAPMVELELQYLFEIKKIRYSSGEIMRIMQREIGLEVSSVDCKKVIKEATSLSWTRDPFDRIIVASSIAAKTKLITKDRLILNNYKNAYWG